MQLLHQSQIGLHQLLHAFCPRSPSQRRFYKKNLQSPNDPLHPTFTSETIVDFFDNGDVSSAVGSVGPSVARPASVSHSTLTVAVPGKMVSLPSVGATKVGLVLAESLASDTMSSKHGALPSMAYRQMDFSVSLRGRGLEPQSRHPRPNTLAAFKHPSPYGEQAHLSLAYALTPLRASELTSYRTPPPTLPTASLLRGRASSPLHCYRTHSTSVMCWCMGVDSFEAS